MRDVAVVAASRMFVRGGEVGVGLYSCYGLFTHGSWGVWFRCLWR